MGTVNQSSGIPRALAYAQMSTADLSTCDHGVVAKIKRAPKELLNWVETHGVTEVRKWRKG